MNKILNTTIHNDAHPLWQLHLAAQVKCMKLIFESSELFFLRVLSLTLSYTFALQCAHNSSSSSENPSVKQDIIFIKVKYLKSSK